MAKTGRPGIGGRHVLLRIPSGLPAELDEVWPRVGSGSRNDFIRRAAAEEVLALVKERKLERLREELGAFP
ncbi:MAG: hypothetical protein QW279_11585 [Candidatus Jordarchaeaceae archaeon]